MKIIGTTFDKLPRERLVIGFEGENLRATVRIDCASVFAEYPNATPTLIVKPLFADAYPVVVDRNGTDVDWLITSEILSFTGDGEIQLVFYKDEVICKSAITKIRVCRSLQVTGDMPDPVAQWIDDANRKLAEVDAQIVELEGMVDTATDAATRAEQSASTASAKAEQAAGSAATATEKATEATNAAGTATAKAAEAEQSALTATEKANAAAESERIATAKAGEATTAAGTATAKAEQATEAAQTATEKAGDASASARAAHVSEINAAESADDALAAKTAAEAAKRAAEASATQAGTSERNAGTASQTATQKAAEATQSATGAAQSAQTATQKAGEAAESAQAAQDAKTAVEQTAEQLAESLEQIEQNTQDIAELDERKANIDGYYPDMTVGNAEQLNSSKYVENSEPYMFRTSGGSSDIGNREYLDAVVGGTLAWNQAVRDEASENQTDFAPIVTVTDAVEDAAGVKVKIEPVQDLHGYDNPWPAGGGKNLLGSRESKTYNIPSANSSFTFEKDSSQVTFTTSGLSSSLGYRFNDIDLKCTLPAGTYYFSSNISNQSMGSGLFVYNADTSEILARARLEEGGRFTLSDTATIRLGASLSASTTSGTYWFQLESGSTATSYAPYSNICPITGWDGVKVTRTGKNLFDPDGTFAYIDCFTSNGEPLKRCGYILNYPAGTYKFSATHLEGLDSYLYLNIVNADGTMTDWHTDFKYFVAGSTINALTIELTEGKHFVLYDAQAIAEDSTNERFTRYNIQIERGSTLTDYEPYAGNTYSITLPTEAGTVYGGELTVNADGSGSLVVDRAETKIRDTSITLAGDSGTNYTSYQLVTITNNIKPAGSSTNKIRAIASTIKSLAWSNAWTPWSIAPTNQNGAGARLIVPYHKYESVSELKEDLGDMQIVYELATPQTYTLTPTEIRTLLGTNNVWADTGDLALTYTGTDEHLILESGKKYLSRISGTDSMLLGSGQEITAAKGADNVFDLTQMFGTAVADYVYGQGAAFFRRWFPNTRYPYNAGELLSVDGLQSHDMVGFNQWDEEWELGYFDLSTGQPVSNSSISRSKNFIPVLPNTVYYYKSGGTNHTLLFYDAEKNYVSKSAYGGSSQTFTTPSNAHFMKLAFVGTTYKNDICINLAHNNSRNGEYEPYEKHSYPLDSTVILRGIPKVDANGVYWDGDRYLPDGTVERRYGIFTFSGIENWEYIQAPIWACSAFRLSSGQAVSNFAKGASIKMIEYSTVPAKTAWNEIALVGDKVVGTITQSAGIVIRDDSITSLSDFRTWINGKSIIYELAEPTTETAQPYHSTQWVSDWGTEEFVSTGIVPVGHETRYPANLRDKLQHLPDAASGNGSYLITQTDGQMVLTPFPAPPSTAGNYVLKATVVNGVATYTWEVAT